MRHSVATGNDYRFNRPTGYSNSRLSGCFFHRARSEILIFDAALIKFGQNHRLLLATITTTRSRIDDYANGHKIYFLSNWAFAATMIVESDISTAPSAGERTQPNPASAPAAKGIATTL